jgi:hypothetical protein
MSRSIGRRGALLGTFAAILTTGVGCGSDLNDLESQRQSWKDARPAHYQFDYTRKGFSDGTPSWRIEVRGEQVVSVNPVDPSVPPSLGPSVADAPTVEKLFQEVADNLLRNSVEVEVRYDSKWHHPADAFFAWGLASGDGFKAENLTSLD